MFEQNNNPIRRFETENDQKLFESILQDMARQNSEHHRRIVKRGLELRKIRLAQEAENGKNK